MKRLSVMLRPSTQRITRQNVRLTRSKNPSTIRRATNRFQWFYEPFLSTLSSEKTAQNCYFSGFLRIFNQNVYVYKPNSIPHIEVFDEIIKLDLLSFVWSLKFHQQDVYETYFGFSRFEESCSIPIFQKTAFLLKKLLFKIPFILADCSTLIFKGKIWGRGKIWGGARQKN